MLNSTTTKINNLVESNKRVFVLLVGGSGSGKGYVLSQITEKLETSHVVIDCDNEKHAGFKSGDPMALLPVRHEYYSQIAESKLNAIFSDSSNSNIVIADKTGKNTNKMLALVEQAKDAGFEPVVIMVDCHIKTMVQRIASRAIRTGRDVPFQIALQARKGSCRTYRAMKQLGIACFKIDNN